MDADQRRSRSGEDRISGLPDELLHDILVRLHSAQAAARTSVLSRRWRHVWAHLPELRLVPPPEAVDEPISFVDTVDAALGGYLAPTLEHLGISLYTKQLHSLHLWRGVSPASRPDALRGGSDSRAVGELSLHVPQWFLYAEQGSGVEQVLELPACEGAKRIELSLTLAWRVRPQQAAGQFTALTTLKIIHAHMEGSDVTALVCTQCPCLRDLNLSIQLIAVSDVSVHSNSLRTLALGVLDTRRLEVVAPRLEELTAHNKPMEAHISAPKLVKVAWQAAYDGPDVSRFVDAGRMLRRLKTCKWASSLTKRFDEVDELELEIDLCIEDVGRYRRFLNETNKLPKCKLQHSIVLGRPCPGSYHVASLEELQRYKEVYSAISRISA